MQFLKFYWNYISEKTWYNHAISENFLMKGSVVLKSPKARFDLIDVKKIQKLGRKKLI